MDFRGYYGGGWQGNGLKSGGWGGSGFGAPGYGGMPTNMLPGTNQPAPWNPFPVGGEGQQSGELQQQQQLGNPGLTGSAPGSFGTLQQFLGGGGQQGGGVLDMLRNPGPGNGRGTQYSPFSGGQQGNIGMMNNRLLGGPDNPAPGWGGFGGGQQGGLGLLQMLLGGGGMGGYGGNQMFPGSKVGMGGGGTLGLLQQLLGGGGLQPPWPGAQPFFSPMGINWGGGNDNRVFSGGNPRPALTGDPNQQYVTNAIS